MHQVGEATLAGRAVGASQMKKVCFVLVVFVAGLVCAASPILQAQTYTVQRWSVSTIDSSPSDCTQKIDTVRQALEDFAVPVTLRFSVPVSREFGWVVVCNERTWWHLKSRPEYRRTNTQTGMTDFANHVVYLNGFALAAGDLRDTVAHEIGHQICQCSDENTANEFKYRIEDQAHDIAKQNRSHSSSVSTFAGQE